MYTPRLPRLPRMTRTRPSNMHGSSWRCLRIMASRSTCSLFLLPNSYAEWMIHIGTECASRFPRRPSPCLRAASSGRAASRRSRRAYSPSRKPWPQARRVALMLRHTLTASAALHSLYFVLTDHRSGYNQSCVCISSRECGWNTPTRRRSIP
jgi:hypothetical protein